MIDVHFADCCTKYANMEASRQWLFSATMLATASILVSFLFQGTSIFSQRQPAHHTSLRQIQWNLASIDQLEAADAPEVRPLEEVYPIASGFGLRKHPILNTRRLHAGVDFAAPKGTAVYAAGSGIIERISPISDSSTFGIHVVILHDSSSVYEGRYRTLYAHLSSASVRKGQRVEAGQHIGAVGSTGRSTAAHLHFEIHLDGQPVNPMEYFPVEPTPDTLTGDSIPYKEFLIR